MVKMHALGHLGNDCIVNNVNGQNVINFSIAHSEKYKDKDGVQKERTLWISASWWNDKLTIAQYLKKGTLVFAEGYPDVKTYQDARGNTIPQLTMRVISVQLCGSSNKGSDNSQQNNSALNSEVNTHVNANSITEPVDDLPF